MKIDSYRTIKGPAEGIYKEKGSKFISYAFPAETLDVVKSVLKKIKKDHFAARHHCYAYRLGDWGEIHRANDDGEPNHSAGDPIFNQLRSNDLTNILIVVVRYFGGTKLGKSGLINAYKTAANDAINQSHIISRTINQILNISFAYEGMNELMRQVKILDLTILEQHYTDLCHIKVQVKISDVDYFRDVLERIPSIKKIENLSG